MQNIPGVTAGCFQCGSPPENAGQVVSPPECPGDGQHYVADFPAQWCPSICWFPANRTLKQHIIDGFPIFAYHRVCKNEYQKMPFSVTSNVVGPNLTGYCQHLTVGKIRIQQDSFLGNHREVIHSAGQPGNFQDKTKKPSSVVFVGELGHGSQTAPQRDLICRMFQKYHLKCSMYGTFYAVAEK